MGGHIIQKWYECSIDDQNHDRYRIEFFDRSLRMKRFMVEIIDWLMKTTIAILSKQGLYTRNTIAVVERKIGNELWRSKGSKRRGVDWESRMSNATIEIIDFGEQLNHSDRDLDHQSSIRTTFEWYGLPYYLIHTQLVILVF